MNETVRTKQWNKTLKVNTKKEKDKVLLTMTETTMKTGYQTRSDDLFLIVSFFGLLP